MAAFVYFLCSISEEVLRICNIFYNSRGSVEECFEYIRTERRRLIIEDYIKSILEPEIPVVLRITNIIEAEYLPKMENDPDLVYTTDKITEIGPGTSFYIKGTILKICERFSINLVLNTPSKDIALHFNPRLPQNYIVRTSKINNTWGQEECNSPLPFSLHRGHKFSVQILVTETEYLISVNGKHFGGFRHRLPFNRVSYLTVRGDVMDIVVDQTKVSYYPENVIGAGTNVIQMGNQSNMDISVSDGEVPQEIPFYGKLPAKFTNGCSLHIHGRIKILPHSFYLNLQQGYKIWPHPDVAFHLNPRFANIGGQHVICRNAWQNGKWGDEERTEINTDFLPGKDFYLTIQCCLSSYNVYLNGKFIAEFTFRVDENSVDYVYIQGDIGLKSIALEQSSEAIVYTNGGESGI